MTSKKPYEHMNDAEEILSKIDLDELSRAEKIAYAQAKISLAHAQAFGRQRA